MRRTRADGRRRNALDSRHRTRQLPRRRDRTNTRLFRLEALEPRRLLSLDAAPLGFLVDRPLDASGTIEVPGEVDTFAFELAGGQTATVILNPSLELAPTVELLTADAASLASASASAGEAALLQTIELHESATYLVAIEGGGTTGDYSVQLLLNAAAEEEPHLRSANDALESAQDLTASFIQLPHGVHRGAVRGQLKGGLRPDAFGYSAIAAPFEFEDIRETGAVLMSDEDDATAQLTALQLNGFRFGFYGRAFGSLFVSSNGLITFGAGDSSFDNGDLTASPATPTIAVLWDDLDLGFGPQGGQVLWEVRGSGAAQRLIVQWNEVEYYPFESLDADRDTITFQAILFEENGVIQLNYRDLAESGEPLLTEGSAATVGVKDAGAQGGRRLVLAHNSGPNVFVGSQQSVRIGAGIENGPAESADSFRFTAIVGQSVTLALDATRDDVLLELVDANGTVLARGSAADNLVQAINDVTVVGDAGEPTTLFARVTPTAETLGDIEYSLLVLRDAVFDSETNRHFDRAQPGRQALGGIAPHDFGEAIVLADFPSIDANGTECLCEPPDTHMAVGPEHVVVVVNTAIAMYHKDGSLAAAPQELTDFFAPSVVAGEEFDFDPVVAYDDLAGRWIVAVIIGATPSAAETDLLYAVSDTSDPTDGFREQHRIDFSGISPGLFADFPKVGFNADAHVFTVNMFAARFEKVIVVAVDKATVLDGDPRTLSHFISERTGGSFTMAAASMHTANSGDPMWFVEEATFGGPDAIRVVRMDDLLSHTPLYSDVEIPVTPYGFTPSAVQPGGIFTTNDPRISNADYRDGRLVAAHTVGMDGEATVRWYEFDVGTGMPTLAQEGRIDPGPGVHAFFPSIAINAAGDLGVTYVQSSAEQFVSMYVAGQVAGAPAGATAQGVLVKAGDETYAGGRGGDYSGIGVDPVTDTFWAANEVILTGADDPLWSTWISRFAVSDVQDEDWYEVAVAAGDELRIETATPFGGPLLPTNTLDPAIALYEPDGRLVAFGDNGAADGRNALIVLTAQQSGLYRVQVHGRGQTSGAYLLRVQGATGEPPPPSIHDTFPDDGVTLGTFPDVLQVTFSESVLATSVDAADLVVDGLPALAAAYVDGATFRFQLDQAAARGDGTYSVTIAAGSVVDLQGTPTAAYQGAFDLDQTGPRILETRWNGAPLPMDRRLATDPLTFEAFFDEPLFVLGSARRGLRRPGSDDAFVVNRSTGETLRPRRVSIDVLRNTFRAEFDPLPEGDYTLTLVSGDTAFEDAVGNPIDGEAAGASADGTPTGDGAPGGDFLVDFVVDRDALVIDDLVRERPRGGLVFSAHEVGRLSPLGDEDTFLVEADAGRILSAVAIPKNAAAKLTLALDGSDPISAAGPGAEVSLSADVVSESRTRTFTLSSDVPTEFDLRIFAGALVERPSSDSTTDRPLAIDASNIELAAGLGSRFAVVAASSPEVHASHLLSQNFEQGLGGFTIDNAFGQGGGLWRLSSGRRDDGDPDHSPPRSLYFGQGESPFVGGDYDTGSVTEGAVFSPEIDLPAAAARITLSFNHFLKTEGFTEFDVAEVAIVTDAGPNIVLSSGDGTLPPDTNGVWQGVAADLTRFAGEQVRLRFHFDSVDGSANFFEGWFVDDVSIVASVVTAAEVDAFTLDVSGLGGTTMDVALAGVGLADFTTATLQIVSADTGDVLAVATAAPPGTPSRNVDLSIAGFVIPAAGNLHLRLLSEVTGDYSLVVTHSLALETEPNDFDVGPDKLRRLNSTSGALGFIGESSVPFELVRQSDPAAFVDISTVGRPLNLSDDGTRALNSRVGNDFFPAGPILISNNGVVLSGVDDYVPFSNTRLPFTGFGAALLPYWDDISDLDGNVYVHLLTIDGVEAQIIQWDSRPHFSSVGTGTFQVQILADGPQPIRFAYRDVDFGQTGINFGASATIGYQRDASTAAEFSVDTPSVMADDVVSLQPIDPSDSYRIDLKADQLATLSIVRPIVGAPRFGEDGLEVRLEVYDPTGTVIATAHGSLGDGKAVVSFVAPADGAYTIRVVPEQGSGEYVLAVSDQPILGDFDADTDVDGDDLLILLLHFGMTAGALHTDGDADRDGDVDRDDLAIWQQNAGLGAFEVPPASKAKPVEPDDLGHACVPRQLGTTTIRTPNPWISSLDLALEEFGESVPRVAGFRAGVSSSHAH